MTAENDVDEIVRRAFFADAARGIMVEVGAAGPDFLSIGASFRKRGWRVIAIEPNPSFCAEHRALGHRIHQYAVSDTEQDDADFYLVNSGGTPYLNGCVSFESFSSLGIRGAHAEIFVGHDAPTIIRVKVRKLETILREHEPDVKEIDILVVDVEGWELNVLRGFSFELRRPKVVILENLDADPAYSSFSHQGNPRAHKLVGKDIITEFEWYEQCADTLTRFARTARTAIATDAVAWPGRPLLPTLQQKKTTSAHRKGVSK